MTERIEWVSDEGRLDALAETWDALAAVAADPFATHTWLSAWRRSFAADAAPMVCLVWRDEQLVGGLALIETADGLRSMTNAQTPSFCPLAADAAALQTVVTAALRASGGVLVLPMLRGDHSLVVDDRRGRWRSLYTAHTTSPIIDLVGTFDDWRALTRPRWRTPIERLARKMRRDHDAELRLVTAPDDLDATIAAGLALESAGWKGREGTAIASSPATAAFYRNVAQGFAARGELRVSSITLDGELVAWALCLLHGNRLWQLKIAFDESYRRLAPGLVMHVEAVRRCYELGLRAYELLGDRSDWKDKFATSQRQYVSWTGYAHGARPTGMYLARRGARRARRARRAATALVRVSRERPRKS